MATTNAAMERNIKDRASSAYNSLSEVEPEPQVEPEPESEASAIRRKSELIEQLTKTLGEKAAQIHMSVNAGMLNPANPDIDLMQLLQLVNINTGLSYADDIENTTQQAVRQTLELVTTDPSQVDEAYVTKLFSDLQQHRMGVFTHVTDIQKTALEKINQELNTGTFILQDETSSLATDQAEQREYIMKMELQIFALENEMDALKKAESDAKTAAEHKNHGDVVIDADHQKELDIRDDEYNKLMTTLEGFNQALFTKQQILGKAKHQLTVINDDYGKAFGADGKLDRAKATDVIAQTTEMKSIIESTQLSMDGINAAIATLYSQSSLVRLPVVPDIKKSKLLTSDDLKEIGNIALEGQKMPQKAERLRDVLMTALRSGTNPNQFDSILPDVCRFLSQDCYVDKWKPHTINDIVDTGDKIVGAFTAEQYSNQNKSFAALIAGISDDMRKMMIAYENNRPITRGSTTTQMRSDRDDAIAFIEIVVWENELTGPDKRDEAIEMINKMHGFVRSKSLKELIIYMRRAVVMGKRFKIKAEWSKTIAKLFKTINYHYPPLGAELKANFSMTIDKHQHDAIPAIDNFISQLDHFSNEMSATLNPVTMNDDHPLYVTDAVNAANEEHLVAMLDDVPPPPFPGKGKKGKGKTGKGKGNGKDGKTGNSKNSRCAVKGCTGHLSNKRHSRFQELRIADQKSDKPRSEYKVPICGACMTAGIENGKIVDLHSGGKMDFGPMKAAFGPDGNRHNKNMAENIRMAYEDMDIDATETVNIAAGAANAGDDEDDVISLSSKASADPSVSDEWQHVHPDFIQHQGVYGPWTGHAQDGWHIPPVMQPAPQPAQIQNLQLAQTQNVRGAAVAVAAQRAVNGMQNPAAPTYGYAYPPSMMPAPMYGKGKVQPAAFGKSGGYGRGLGPGPMAPQNFPQWQSPYTQGYVTPNPNGGYGP